MLYKKDMKSLIPNRLGHAKKVLKEKHLAGKV